MKSEQDWLQWFIENCQLTSNQIEFSRRGELENRLTELSKAISTYQNLNAFNHNFEMLRLLVAQKEAIFFFLNASKKPEYDKSRNFYHYFAKALIYYGCYSTNQL